MRSSTPTPRTSLRSKTFVWELRLVWKDCCPAKLNTISLPAGRQVFSVDGLFPSKGLNKLCHPFTKRVFSLKLVRQRFVAENIKFFRRSNLIEEKMEKIRELFHKVFNHLNNISVMSGSVREDMDNKNLSDEERKLRDESAVKSLAKIEDYVGQAAATLEELRVLIKPKEGE